MPDTRAPREREACGKPFVCGASLKGCRRLRIRLSAEAREEMRERYISRERGFLIANACAGVNFLITAFLTLSMRKLLVERPKEVAWRFIPAAAVIAYLATLVANATRITIALLLRQSPVEIGWLNPGQLHRVEGVFIYFGFLLLLFVASEKMSAEKTSDFLRRLFLPLLVYYAIALGIPLANGGYRQGADFWRHALFVLAIPLLLTLSSLIFRRVVQVAMWDKLRPVRTD